MPHFAPAIYAARDQIAMGEIGRVSGASGRSSHGGPEVYYSEVRDAFEETGNDLWFFDALRRRLVPSLTWVSTQRPS